MEGETLLTQALVYLAAGVVSVPIAKRLGMGSVLGYLIAGVIIGPYALDLVGASEQVLRVGEFGVVILLFLIGLEVRPALLWRMKTTIFGLGLAQMLFSTALLGALVMALGSGWKPALAAGLILALSSTAIVLQSLEERGMRQGAVGEATFGVLLLQDLAVIPLFALIPLLGLAGGHAAAEAGHGDSVISGLPIWWQTLIGLGAILSVIIGGRYLTRPIFRFIAAARLREIFTASALLLVVAVATLMQLVGLSPALGAFLAGVVLAESEFRRELETDIEPFRGLLLGLFFITVGAGLDVAMVASQPAVLLALVAGLIALKALAMFAAGRLFGLSKRDAATTAAALAQGGEFAFVLLGYAAGARVFDPEQVRMLTAVVALSMAATPVVMAVYLRIALKSDLEPGEAREPDRIEEAGSDVIIAGFGRFGQVVERLLTANGFSVVTLESSLEQIDTLRKFGRKVYYGDASRLDLLRTAGAEQAKLLLIAIDDRDKAVDMTEAVKEAFPNLVVLARAWDRRHAYELLSKGADEIERETFEGGLAMGRRALERLGFSERRATRAASIFRRHDLNLFNKLAPVAGEEERYILATRDSRETMDRLMQAELARADAEDAAEARANEDQPARRAVGRDGAA